MPEHTALPWKHNGIKHFGPEAENACAIWKGETPICTTSFSLGKYKALPEAIQDANARLIVRAVNNHQSLIDGLRDLLAKFPTCCVNTEDKTWHSENCITAKARAAIALAEEEPCQLRNY